jgi:hypothetical protein
MQMLNSLKAGEITIDFFTSALSEMTKAGFDAASGMEALADELAGHSVTTAAESAAKSVNIFMNAINSSNQAVTRGVTGLHTYSKTAINGMSGAIKKVRDFQESMATTAAQMPTFSIGGLTDTLANIKDINIKAPTFATPTGVAENNINITLKSDIQTFDKDATERWLRRIVYPKIDKYLDYKGLKVRK